MALKLDVSGGTNPLTNLTNYCVEFVVGARPFSHLDYYAFSTDIIAPSGSGAIQLNNATYGSATTLYISNSNNNAVNHSTLLSAMISGILTFQSIDTGDMGQIVLQITGPPVGSSSATSYRAYPVTVLSSTAPTFTNGELISVVWSGP